MVRETLVSGTLKNRAVLQDFTAMIQKNCGFDPEFYFLEFRSGLIKSIFEAPEMDKILCEEVVSNRNYFICSGLRGVYEKSDLEGNVYLFLLNIKKAKFRNYESEGMICCAESENIEAIRIEDKDTGMRIHLENMIELFDDIDYGKIDFSKAAYKSIFSEFKIINHFLTFKGKKIVLNSKYIKTKAANSIIR